jgi:cytochrome c oxidase assembly protein subunit 15
LENRKQKVVAWWLLTGVLMIIIQTLLGGVTRLTGSGLSITKWNPIFGILPPLNAKQWDDAFNSYKQIGQFKLVNSYYTLHDFKSIFFWEWLHRVWARILFVVFMTGFIYFTIKRYFSRDMIVPLALLLLLGAMQGVVGILMVWSGVNPEDIHVNYTWLAAHFISAMILACYTLWFALKLLIPQEKRVVNQRANNYTLTAIGILFLQLMYGAFMAGLKAANAASTWPDINGSYFPGTLMTNGLLKDTNLNALMINVHFMHRTIAYILLAMIVAWYFYCKKNLNLGTLKSAINWPIILVLLQVVLGIITVLLSPKIVLGKFGLFETFAQLHQLVAMFLLMALVVNLYVVKRQPL